MLLNVSIFEEETSSKMPGILMRVRPALIKNNDAAGRKGPTRPAKLLICIYHALKINLRSGILGAGKYFGKLPVTRGLEIKPGMLGCSGRAAACARS